MNRRVVIFSASVGAGHDSFAAALADRLDGRGLTVDRHDFLDLMPAGSGRLLRASYKYMLKSRPGMYERVYERTMRHGKPGVAQRRLLRASERAVLEAVPDDTAAVVATYPLAAQVLGRLRRTGRIAVPVVTCLTDFSVHPLWITQGVDLYLAACEEAAAQARAHGATQVRTCGPLVDRRFGPSSSAAKADARRRFGLPAHGSLALLVGGSWGVGDLARTAADLADSKVVVPVVVCGKNQELAHRLRTNGIAHVFGWVDDMPGLMAAADVMVQNAGAASTLEAFAAGLPVATYRCLPGHGRYNAAVLDRAGLAVRVRSYTELAPALERLAAGPLGRRQRASGLALVAAEAGAGSAESAVYELIRAASGEAVVTTYAIPAIPAQRGAEAARLEGSLA
ncbi:MAG: MGDG synthase family glycosyltransferase [Actinocrinis sp.]